MPCFMTIALASLHPMIGRATKAELSDITRPDRSQLVPSSTEALKHRSSQLGPFTTCALSAMVQNKTHVCGCCGKKGHTHAACTAKKILQLACPSGNVFSRIPVEGFFGNCTRQGGHVQWGIAVA